MIAARISEENKGLRIHLQDKQALGTLCASHMRMDIADFNVSTGWPDCEKCIKLATDPPKAPPSYGWSPA